MDQDNNSGDEVIKPTFKTPDFRQAITRLDKVSKRKAKELELEIEDSADRIVLAAKSAAPITEGSLRREISRKKLQPLQYAIVADTKYAAFMEFGTSGKEGSSVVIPPGAEKIAADARRVYKKGKKGTIEEMERAIRRWVKLKGLAGTYSVKTRRRTGGKAQIRREDDSLVFLIMRKILKVGVKPQPFFYPAIQKETPILGKRIAKVITND